MARLTKIYVDRIVAPEKAYKIHWDDSVKGFGLRVTSANKRSYIVQARVRGRSVRCTIGPTGRWTPDLARTEGKKLLRDMDMGINPREVQKVEEAAKTTLRGLTDEYLKRDLKDSSRAQIEGHVTTTLKLWLHKPVVSITGAQVSKRFNEVRLYGLTGKGPAPAQAQHGFVILRALINYFMIKNLNEDGSPILVNNPCKVLKNDWVRLNPRTTRIPEKKVGDTWYALQTARAAAYNPHTLASIELVQFLLLTGARLNEGAALKWENVNLDEGWWHLPDPKNGNPIWLPLSTAAVELLAARPRVKSSPFVFPSWGASGHLTSVANTMKSIVSPAAGLELTAHDLRRTFTTIGIAKLGIDVFRIELLTGHLPGTVTLKHYLETQHLEYLQPEVQRIADHIVFEGAIAEATATGANVLPLHA